MRWLSVQLGLAGLLATTPVLSPFTGVAAANLGNKKPVIKGQQPESEIHEPTRSQQQRQRQQVLSPDWGAEQPHKPPPAPDDSSNNNDHNPENPNRSLPAWLDKYKPGFVAFGDSYSAGIGTTIPPGTEENTCRQGNGAYPYLIFSDFMSAPHRDLSSTDNDNEEEEDDDDGAGAGPSLQFQWLSCTGSTTTDVLGTSSGNNNGSASQIDRFNFTSSQPPSGTSGKGGGGTTFAMLSIGGNDVGFFDVINACVFRFYAFYSGTCEEALSRSERLISAALRWQRFSSSSFVARSISELEGIIVENGREGDSSGEGDDGDKTIDQDAQLLVHKIRLILLEILDKVHWERNPDFSIIMTGYARFFNAETIPCDEASLGVWLWRDDTTGATAMDGNTEGRVAGGKGGSKVTTGDLKKRGGRPSKAHYLQEGTMQTRRDKHKLREQIAPSSALSSSYRPKLTRDVRKRMNELVEGVNLLLDGIAGDVNARFGYTPSGSNTIQRKKKKKVIFVNSDHLFEGHRFCEEGVHEPEYNRTETWFFLPGGGDNFPNGTATISFTDLEADADDTYSSGRDGGQATGSGGQFQAQQSRTVQKRERQRQFLSVEEYHLVDPKRCLERITAETKNRGRSDWGEKALCYMAMVNAKNPHLLLDQRLAPVLAQATNDHERSAGNLEAGGDTVHPLNRDSMWYVPTYYGKTFHPRTLAHQAIKDRIYEVWEKEERDD